MITRIMAKGSLILVAKFFHETHLGMLQLTWLGVVVFLPRQLSHETVAEPNVDVSHMISISSFNFSAFYQISAQEVPMHERP